MSLIDDAKKIAESVKSEWKEKKGIYSMEIVVAERKAFLSKKKLTYIAKFRADEDKKELRFTEMLKESGFGLSSGDSDMSPGFGFKTESYNTMSGAREGSIKEQSELFGKQYKYEFDYGKIRAQFEDLAKKHRLKFHYQVTAIGL